MPIWSGRFLSSRASVDVVDRPAFKLSYGANASNDALWKLTAILAFAVVTRQGLEECPPGEPSSQDKFHLDAVSKRQAIGYSDSAPLLDGIVAWTPDATRPVAKPIADLLVSMVLQPHPHCKDCCKELTPPTSISSVAFGQQVAVLLQKDLVQIVEAPTTEQVLEGVCEPAADILRKFDDVRPKEQS